MENRDTVSQQTGGGNKLLKLFVRAVLPLLIVVAAVFFLSI